MVTRKLVRIIRMLLKNSMNTWMNMAFSMLLTSSKNNTLKHLRTTIILSTLVSMHKKLKQACCRNASESQKANLIHRTKLKSTDWEERLIFTIKILRILTLCSKRVSLLKVN